MGEEEAGISKYPGIAETPAEGADMVMRVDLGRMGCIKIYRADSLDLEYF